MVDGATAAAVIGHAPTLPMLAFLLLSQPSGMQADRLNRKAILIISGAGLVAGTLLPGRLLLPGGMAADITAVRASVNPHDGGTPHIL